MTFICLAIMYSVPAVCMNILMFSKIKSVQRNVLKCLEPSFSTLRLDIYNNKNNKNNNNNNLSHQKQ